MERHAKSGWGAALLLALLVFAGYLFIASRTTLFDRDEPRFAQATVEMVHSGNYLYPTFNAELRPDKPIMIYWLMAGAIHLLGPTEVVVRLPSVAAAAGSVLLTFWIGRRFWGAWVGLAAGVVMSTTVLMPIIGSAATADSVLLLFLVAAMGVHTDALLRGRMGVRHVLMLGVAVGGATLTKGPVGLAVPILAIVTADVLLKRARAHESQAPPPAGASQLTHTMIGPSLVAALIGLLLFLAWGIPANRATGGAYASKGLGHHVIDRVLRPLEHHGDQRLLSLGYYLPCLLVMAFPWTLFLPGAASAACGNRLGGSVQRAFLIGWTIPTLILMSLVATKLPHYILPMWPALALGVGATLQAQRDGRLNPRDHFWLRAGVWLFVPMLGLWLFGGLLFWLLPAWAAQRWSILAQGAPLLRWPMGVVAICVVVLGIFAVCRHLAGRYQAAAATLAIGTVGVVLLVAIVLLPPFDRLKPSPALAAMICQHSAADVPVVTCGYAEPTLNFYLARIPIYAIERTDVALWAHRSGPGVLVISAGELNDAEHSGGPLGLVEIGQAHGLGNTSADTLDLRVMGRHLPEAAKVGWVRR